MENYKLFDSKYFDNQIKNLETNESGYSVPWAMWIDYNNNCWLNENYTVHHIAGNNTNIKIKKLENGYLVNISKSDHKWTPQKYPTYISPIDVCFGKVIKLIK